MTTTEWFDDLPVIGKLRPVEAAAKLRELGENDVATALEAPASQSTKARLARSEDGTKASWRTHSAEPDPDRPSDDPSKTEPSKLPVRDGTKERWRTHSAEPDLDGPSDDPSKTESEPSERTVRSGTLDGWRVSEPNDADYARPTRRLWPFQDKPWQHTAHAFGYLAPAQPGSQPRPIHHAGNITADPSLKNSRIRITLDRLRVADYPGGGTHRILFDFYAQNQVADNVEHLHFNSTYRVREGQQAAIVGYPIFIGLNVGSEGVAFKCFTVNVKNDDDEALLGFLESDVFKAGLKLVSTAQPAIGPLSGMAIGLTKSIAGRNRNVPVQDFYMGLDFSSIPTGARLAEGAYIAVQIPETLQTVWDWSAWVYNPANGQVVNKANPKQLISYNYIVFGVSRIE